MSEVLERISQRYHDERLRIEIPEWGKDGEPLVAFSQPFTVYDEGRALKGLDVDDPRSWARIVFHKLETEEGARVFNGDDFQRFVRTADTLVVKRIGAQIMAGTTSLEEARGNSEGTSN